MLGPVLLLLYIAATAAADVIKSHNILRLKYADDIQLYIEMSRVSKHKEQRMNASPPFIGDGSR
jgi:hypothetical protein